jgi:hypothetical protein
MSGEKSLGALLGNKYAIFCDLYSKIVKLILQTLNILESLIRLVWMEMQY